MELKIYTSLHTVSCEEGSYTKCTYIPYPPSSGLSFMNINNYEYYNTRNFCQQANYT